jgi:four helix bundle protein
MLQLERTFAMGTGNLAEFGGYRKALELFDLVVEDMDRYMKLACTERLVSQQIASADSICSNIEEGYGRQSTKEFVRFLDIARGSARETRGRYRRMRHWIPTEIVIQRLALAEEVIKILSSTINHLRKPPE